MRPAELADDYTPTLDVINHALTWLGKNKQMPDFTCILYATSPFIQSDVIKNAFTQLKNDATKHFCFGVTQFPFPIQRAIKINPTGCIEMFQPEHFNTRSQDLEKAYHDAGQFYWGNSEAFLRRERMFSDLAVPYILPSYQVQDIDELDDWIKAEAMFHVLNTDGIATK